MRYEDASGAFQASGPVANDDSDTLPAGSKQPATGNLITGEGTQYASSGADSAAGAQITNIAGKGGEDSSFAGGKLSVAGEFGNLSVDAQGNYIYKANANAPENVRDRFTYTLADSSGNSDTAALVVELGKTPVVVKADAQQVIVGPDGVVTLPPGVELSDIMVVGRNLIVTLPDGSQMIIVDGAIFVPQLVLGGVEVPATNVAALLIGQEPQPAAGELPPSSGGNFALPPPPLDPGAPLGDLIPPMEDTYIPPEPQEVFDEFDRDPEVLIQPDDQAPSVSAIDSVDEKGLPTRNGGEPEGSVEGADGNPSNNSDSSEATSGTILIDSPDGVDSVTIAGADGIPHDIVVGLDVQGEFGTLTITGIVGNDYTYSYVLNDNTSGDNTQDDFLVVLTDGDGDTAIATLTIDIIDDVPIARDDIDAVIEGQTSTDGNVMTSAGAVNSPAGADTVGADDATLTGIHPGTSGSFTNVPGGGVTVVGTFGDLTINPDGSYTYTLHEEGGDGGTDVFTYQLTDGDGDTDTATLTISVPTDLKPVVGTNPVVLLDDDALENGNPGDIPRGDDPDADNVSGQLSGSGGDAPLTFEVQLTGAPAGFIYESGGDGIVLIKQGTTTVVTVTVNADGSYSVVQNNPIVHADGGDENNQAFTINYTVTDHDGDSAPGTLSINVDDDSPDLANVVAGGDVTLDESNFPFPVSDSSALPVIDFDALFGADGAALVDSQVFGLSITGGPDSGITTAVGDFAITLVLIDDQTIEGHYDGDNVAFRIEILADGTVTLIQYVPLEHLVDGPPGPDHDDSLDLGGLIAATVTITDGDGDQATVSAGIGDRLVFLDDGPSVSQGQATGTVDEDGVVEGIADEGEGDGIAGGTGDIAGEGTVASGSVVAIFNPGADAPLSFGFAANAVATLQLLGLRSNGLDLEYAIVGDTITASTDAGDVFTLQLESDGDWMFTLIDQLDHAEGDDENDLLINLGNIVQATDSDGDFVIGAADGLVITINDDTPTVSDGQVTGTVDEDGVLEGAADGGEGDGILGGTGDVPFAATVASGSVDAMFHSGADAPLSYAFAADAIATLEGLGLTSNDLDLEYAIVGDTITASTAAGNVFTFELTADGSWTFTLIDQLDHETGIAENDLTINLGNIIGATDADGDTVVGAADGLAITVDDDTPVARPDEDTVPAGGDIITGNVITGADTDTGIGGTDSTGADAPGVVTGLASNNVDGNIDNDPAGGGFIVAGEFGQLTLQPDGSYGYDRFGSSPGDVEDVFTYTYTDADGDSVETTLTIHINDSAPTLDPPLAAVVDDDDVAGANGIPGGDDDDAPANTSGTLSATGGDGDIDFFFAGTQPTLPLGFTHNLVDPTTMQILQGATVVLTITLDNDAGEYSIVQNNPVVHAPLNNAAGDDTENNSPVLNVGLVAIDEDGTGDESNVVNLSVTVDDDTPSATIASAVQTVSVDETAGIQGDSSDTVDPAVIALFSGVGTKGTDSDMPAPQYGTSASALVTSSGSAYGADGAGTTLFSLDVSATGVDSGLDTTAGVSIFLFLENGLVVGRAGADAVAATSGPAAFAVSINPTTGVVSMVQYMSLDHPNPATPDEPVSIADGAILGVVTVTDSDGDSDTSSVGIGDQIQFQDDAPAITSAEDINIENSGDIAHTGAFQFDVGADGAPLGDDVFSVTGSATVNGVAVTNWSMSETSENASFAIYAFSFDYPVGGGLTAHETGTLTFDKASGTYTVDLANPIAGISVDSVQGGQPPTFYDVDQNGDGDTTDNVDNNIVAVVEIADDLFIQFTGQSGVDTPTSEFGNNDLWGGGTPSEVKISSTAIGVFGNTVQPGDMLDYNFYESDPGAVVGIPTASAGVAFIKVSQFNGAEDFVITLKLADPDNIGGTMIERTFVINADDVLTVAPPGYPALTQGTGFIIFEPNDYRNLADVPDNYEIVGMQLRSSTEGISSTPNEVYNFDGDLGEADVSPAQFNLLNNVGTNDNDVLKIEDIGVVRVTTTDQDAELTFNVTIQDGDSDTDSLTLTATVTADPDGETAIDTTSTLTAMPAPMKVSSAEFAFVSTNENERLAGGQGNTGIIAGIVAAAGMATKAAAAHIDSYATSDHQTGDLGKDVVGNPVAGLTNDTDSRSLPMLDANSRAESPNPTSPSTNRSYESADSRHSVDDSPVPPAVERSDQPANALGPATTTLEAIPVAPTVSVPSAEALQAIASSDPQEVRSVEQVVAAALYDAGTSPIDTLLANLPGGHDGLGMIAHLLNLTDDLVAGWSMVQHDSSGAGFDVTSKIDAGSFHHDAVQPTANG